MIRAETIAKIAQLYLQGQSLYDISDSLGISISTTFRYLDKARADWLAASVETVELIVAKELARIDAIERAAWVGWNRSLLPSKSVTTMPGKGRSKKPHVITTRQKQNGDPRFLAVVQKCVEQRAKLLRLDRSPEESTDQPGVIEVIIESKAELKSITSLQDFRKANPEFINHSSTDGATEGNEHG
ncbi:MAG: hypothetical protein U0930_04950 [Pirellulales bacterium]